MASIKQSTASGAAQPAAKSSTFSSGILLTRGGLLALLAILFLAAWGGYTIIVVLVALVFAAAGTTRLWSRYCLNGVSCQRLLSDNRAFPGETIELRHKLANRKLLPLPWIDLDDEVPLQLLPAGTELTPAERPGYRLLNHTTSLLWYTAVNWRQQLSCRKRGCYRLGAMTVTSGDIFGIYPRSTAYPAGEEIIVYPKLYSISPIAVPSLYPIGETVAQRRIFEDPTRTIGVRDYTPQDGLRHIHWKASARHQNLQVKVFEPTTTLKVALFLDIESFKNTSDDEFELGVSTAASIAHYLIEKRSQVGVFANSPLPDSDQPVSVQPGGGTPQLLRILESLAKVTFRSSGAFADFFQQEWSRLPWGTTPIIILAKPSQHLPALLARIKEAGYRALVAQVGDYDGSGVAEETLLDTATWLSITCSADRLEFIPRRGA